MRYKNLSEFTKTFYGVEIKPGEVKDIPGNVNDPKVVPWFINEPAKVEEAPAPSVPAEPVADAENPDSTGTVQKSSRKRTVKEA